MITAAKEELTLTAGEDNLGMYQWNTKTVRHYFCKTCGIYTHHKMRSKPDTYGLNVGCIDEIDQFTLENVGLNDGHNHPMDQNKS